MPAANAFSNILRKRRQTVNVADPCRSYIFPYFSIQKAITRPNGLTLLSICLLQTKRNLYIGSGILSLLLDIFHFFVSTYLTIVKTTPHVDFHHRLTACPSYHKKDREFESRSNIQSASRHGSVDLNHRLR